MTKIKLKGNEINTKGDLPKVGGTVADFTLVKNDLAEATLNSYVGKRKILSIFPSLDTEVCASSVRSFNKNASELSNVAVLNISMDLPFAMGRFCAAEGIDNVETLSAFRSSFVKDYNVEIIDGPLKGLCSRAVVILDENNKVLYVEQVPEITQEPDYGAALSSLK